MSLRACTRTVSLNCERAHTKGLESQLTFPRIARSSIRRTRHQSLVESAIEDHFWGGGGGGGGGGGRVSSRVKAHISLD